mmetsp:Transcript_77121/g.121786  ORF Transcript_77121/g.121786 Transcript_77121/m.121786 type:complete len:530 (+) Transcript_77121:85-1674(+)
MEGEEIAQKKDDDEVCHRERVAKTYNSIAARKEMQLAKNAQFERRAWILTKHFMKESDQRKKQQADDLLEASQRSYERSMQRVNSGYANETMLKEMVREEKHQISQLMSMRAKQRDSEEEKKKEKEEERQYLREARSLYDRMQTEERQKALEEKQRERKESIQERLKEHDDRCKELLDKKAEDQAAISSRFETQLAKVMETRKAHERSMRMEQHKKWKAHQEKEKAAEEARQKAAMTQRESIRTREEERHRRVLERQRAEEEETSARIQRILAKGPANRSNNASRSDSHGREQRSERPSTIGEVKKKEQEESTDQQKADAERKERSARHLAPLPTTWRDLKETNAEVHKEYVARCAEMSKAATKMQTQNRFKTLAEGASDEDDDLLTMRLKSVHRSLVAKKPREKHKDAPISTRGSKRPVARTALMMTCGLCAREFPPDHMVGSALRTTVDRLRQQSPNVPKQKAMSAREKSDNYQSQQSYLSEGREESPDHRSTQSEKHAKYGTKKSLYDYEVKLCVNCDIFVRIAST